MEWTGLLARKLDEKSGVSSRGSWRIGVYLLEEQGMYPRKMMVEVSNGLTERIAQWDAMVGKMVTIQFDIDAREYNGQWYNSVRAFGIKSLTTGEG